MEIGALILVIVLAVVILLLLGAARALPALIVNAVVGVVLIFLTNLVLADDIPINFFTIAISAIGGAFGWLLVLLLHLLGIAF